MPNSSRPLRTSLQAKVLSAVLALLVLLPAAMLWVVNRQITLQTHDDASRSPKGRTHSSLGCWVSV